MAPLLCDVEVVAGVTAAPMATTTTTPWRREKRPFTIVVLFLELGVLGENGTPSVGVGLASRTFLPST